ncbi:unnamed protein product [Boreogadus saida]
MNQIPWTRRTQENPDHMDQENPGEPRSHGPGLDFVQIPLAALRSFQCTLGDKRVDGVVGEPAAQRLYALFVTLRWNQTPL